MSEPISVALSVVAPTLIVFTCCSRSATNFSYDFGPTTIRHAAVQSCPAFQKLAARIVSAARSRSASSKMSTGALPPSSRWSRLTLSAPAAAMRFPVAVSPVTETMSMPGCRESAAPTSEPGPVMTFKTPGGKISCASAPSISALIGVRAEGLSTIVLPVASAGPIFQPAIRSG